MLGAMPGATNPVPPGQGQITNHVQASLMAHAAAQKAAVGKVLAGGMKSPAASIAPAHGMPANFKAHVVAHAAAKGVQAGIPDVHAAIGAVTNAGGFTPAQGAALTQHNGPLFGPAGSKTIATLGNAVASMKGAPGAF